MAEVIDINYPKEASAGQQIDIYVTVDFWISSEPEGLFVCVQNMDDYKDVEVFGATMPSPFVLEQREPLGPLPKGPTTKTYRFSYDVPLYAKYELILAAEAYLLYRGDPKVGHDWELRLADTKSFKIVISPEVKPSGELLTNGGFDQGTIGWKAFGNETPTSANTYITVFGHEGEGLAVNFQLGRSKYQHSSGVSQVIEEYSEFFSNEREF